MLTIFHCFAAVRTQNSNNLTSETKIQTLIQKLSDILGTKIIDQNSHKFDPSGFTAYALLKESHIAIHTWPEERKVILDIVSCKVPKADISETIKTCLHSTFAIESLSLDIDIESF